MVQIHGNHDTRTTNSGLPSHDRSTSNDAGSTSSGGVIGAIEHPSFNTHHELVLDSYIVKWTGAEIYLQYVYYDTFIYLMCGNSQHLWRIQVSHKYILANACKTCGGVREHSVVCGFVFRFLQILEKKYKFYSNIVHLGLCPLFVNWSILYCLMHSYLGLICVV